VIHDDQCSNGKDAVETLLATSEKVIARRLLGQTSTDSKPETWLRLCGMFVIVEKMD
jgi:hypothetical protein